MTPERRLLLSSIVHADTTRAREAWDQLVATFGDEPQVLEWCNSGIGERRLLPALGRRSDELHLSSLIVEACTEARIESWGLNERLMRDCAPVLEDLHANGHDLMCLKGNALLGDVYPPTEARALGDFDLVVRSADVKDAIETLRRHEWRPIGNPNFYTLGTRKGIRGIHAIDFFHPSGSSIDLHVRPAHDLRMSDGDLDQIWAESIPLAVHHPLSSFGILRPSCAVQVLVIVANVSRFDLKNPAHPLLDLCKILQGRTTQADYAFDWDDVRAKAERYCAVHRLRSTLRTVRDLGVVIDVDPETIEYKSNHDHRIESKVLRIDRLIPDEKESGLGGSLRRAKSRVIRVTMDEGLFSKVLSFVVVGLETGRTKWQLFASRLRLKRG